jgi:hypothetical protein
VGETAALAFSVVFLFEGERNLEHYPAVKQRGYKTKAGGGKQTGGGWQVITRRKQSVIFLFFEKCHCAYLFSETVLLRNSKGKQKRVCHTSPSIMNFTPESISKKVI